MFRTIAKRLLRVVGIEAFDRRNLPRCVSLDADLAILFADHPGLSILDVGANVGQTTIRFAAAFPSARIEAFEPIAATFHKLSSAVNGSDRIRAHRLALGDRDGTARMTVCADSTWNRVCEDNQGSAIETVPMATLDTFCNLQGISSIDLLKIDAEGYELQILRGAAGLLARRAISAVYCEVNFRRDGDHGDYFAIEEYLKQFQFVTLGFYEYSGWRDDTVARGFANALFVRT